MPLRRLETEALIVARGVRSSCETEDSRADLQPVAFLQHARRGFRFSTRRARSSARAPWLVKVLSSLFSDSEKGFPLRHRCTLPNGPRAVASGKTRSGLGRHGLGFALANMVVPWGRRPPTLRLLG